MLPQNYLLSTPQQNIMLINNQQMHNLQIISNDNTIQSQTEGSMVDTPFSAFETNNANMINIQNNNQTAFNQAFSQQSNFKVLYPPNNCMNTYLNNFNNNISNNNFLSNQIYTNQFINHSVGIAQPQGFIEVSDQGLGVNSTLVGLPNHYNQQQLVQLHPNKQQFEFKQQQSSGMFQIAPDQQGPNLCSGYMTQFQTNQPRIMMSNNDIIQMNQQLSAESVFKQVEILQSAHKKQYASNLIHQNLLQQQNTFSPNSLQNVYPIQQNSNINSYMQQLPAQVFIQPQKLSDLDQLCQFKQQSNNLNQLSLYNNQISLKTTYSQNTSSYQDEDNENQIINQQALQQDDLDQSRNRQQDVTDDLQMRGKNRNSSQPEKNRDRHKDSVKLLKQENCYPSSQIIANKEKIQNFIEQQIQIKKSEEEEKEELQLNHKKQQKEKKSSKANSSVRIDISKKISQKCENDNNPNLIQYQDEQIMNQQIEANNQKKFQSKSTNNNDKLQIASLSSSPVSLNKQEKQQKQTLIKSEEQKSNKIQAQCEVSKDNDQRHLVDLFVDNRKRSTSVDHSIYLQLYSLLNDKKAVDEFTDLVYYRGTENIEAQNLNNQNSDFNSPSLNSTKSQEIKKYKQLLNQTFIEIKFSNQPCPSYSYIQAKEEHQLKIEESDDIQEYKLTNFTSFNQKTEKVNQIVQSIEAAILSRIPLLFKEEKILESFNLIPSGQYQVYSTLQNMCIQFVRGEKRKRFKERNKDSQYMSRFHNLNRLFFYQIMSMYSYEALSCFQIDPNISEQLRNIISCIKIHSKLQLITEKSKTQEDASLNKQAPSANSTQKAEKRKRSQSQNDNQDLDEYESKTKNNAKGDFDQAPQKLSSKKKQKINEKSQLKSQKIKNPFEPETSQQHLSSSNYSKINLARHESQSISTQDNQSRKRASTTSENSKFICEQSFDQKATNLFHYQGENSSLISQTPSPVNTMSKTRSEKDEVGSKIFTLNSELDTANQVTAKKYTSQLGQELSHFYNANSEQEENTGLTISNVFIQKEEQILNSQKQLLRSKKVQKIESSSSSLQQEENSKESEEKVHHKHSTDDDCGEGVEEDYDEEDDQYKDFPIKNFKKYYRILKVENYTHSHYNTLFLKLNESSMECLKKQQKDVDSHWLAYKIDLRDPSSIPEEKIKFVNTMKSLFYKIFVHFNNFEFSNKEEEQAKILKMIANDPNQPIDQDSQEFKQIQLRLDYYLRVVQGILKLNQGQYSHKF